MKKILPLLFIATIVLHQKSKAQQIRIDTSYHLFFYKGEKLKENVLRTPQGDVVTYDPAKRTLKKVSKSGTGKELDNMLAEVNKTDQRTREMVQKLAGSLPRTVAPYYAKPLKESYDEVKELYGEALSNCIEINEMPGYAKPSAAKIAERGKIMEVNRERLKIEEMKLHAECRAYIKQHENENIEVPVPPEKDYRYCAQCDEEIKKRYKIAYKEFHEKLQGEETRLIAKVLAMERTKQLLGGDEWSEGGIQDSIINFIMKRMGKKANLLLTKFGNDPLRIESAIPAALSIERMRQLSGIPDTDAESLKMDAIAAVLKNLLNYFEKAIDEYDYSIALNPTLLLSAYRQYLLMGGDESNTGELEALYNRALSLNSFKLNIKVSGKLADGDFKQLAELKGDNYFAAVLDSASKTTCRLKWVLMDPDPEKKYMKFDLVDAIVKGNGGEAVYVGTKKWESPAPKLRIDFCNNGNDTAFITSFGPDGKELWKLPEVGIKEFPLMSNVLLGCFMDIDRLTKEAADKNAMTKKMEEMKRQAEAFKKYYTAGRTPSASQIQNMMSQAKALSAGSMVSDMMQEYAVGSYLILPKPQNKSKLVFKERLDGKELFPQNPKTEYAWFDISLENDPKSQ